MKTKAELRTEALTWRSMLTSKEIMHTSRRISDQLEFLDWSNTQKLHIFLPIESKQEIDVRLFLWWLWQSYPAIETWVPMYRLTDKQLYHMRITSKSVLIKTDLGQLIDPSSAVVAQNYVQFDRIIVPCLMSDSKNNRLGYGRGVYDAFLKHQQSAEKIGINYRCMHQELLPSDNNDVPMTRILVG